MMAGDLLTSVARFERELAKRFPVIPHAEGDGIRFAGGGDEIHVHDDGALAWHARGTQRPPEQVTLPSDVARQIGEATRTLLDREQWLLNRLAERGRQLQQKRAD
jgi:hypothetical protein